MTSSVSEASALHGVRVLEIGSFIAGPFAGQQLGDLGANVIKLEHPTKGDPMRHWRDFGNGDLWWPSIARNKSSVSLDLSDERARDVFMALVRQCDVLLENFRPGTLEQWNIGPDALLEINPSLVITRISGFGQSGPRSRDPGFGSVGEAMGGLRHLTGWPDRVSTRVGVSLGDQVAALFAVIGTLGALRHAERTGEGQVVDVAIYEAVFAIMESLVAEYELAGSIRGRTGPALPGVVPSNAYPTADGDEVLIAANADPIYARLVDALGLVELANDPSLSHHTDRASRASVVDQVIEKRTAQMPTAELIETLRQASVPCGQIYTASDIAADEHFAARGAIVRKTVDGVGEVAMPAATPRLSRTPGRINHVGPRLGEHTDEVLAEVAGLDRRALDELRRRGVV